MGQTILLHLNVIEIFESSSADNCRVLFSLLMALLMKLTQTEELSLNRQQPKVNGSYMGPEALHQIWQMGITTFAVVLKSGKDTTVQTPKDASDKAHKPRDAISYNWRKSMTRFGRFDGRI